MAYPERKDGQELFPRYDARLRRRLARALRRRLRGADDQAPAVPDRAERRPADPVAGADARRRTAAAMARRGRRYATTPCNQCGAPIVLATARQPDGTARPVPMDPSVPVYHRVVDPDDEGRAAFWVEDQAPPNEYRQALARHRCASRRTE